MKIVFLGGTETVTGSKFLLQTEHAQVLIDCGLYQGYKWLRERNWQPLPIDWGKLDAVVLTHAHLDHSGYLPVLYKRGYRGPVYTQHAIGELCQILLADSGHIQEEDANYYRKHKLGKHQHPEPLYDAHTAEATMQLFKTVDFGEAFTIGDIQFQLQPAGHILGAASIIAEAEGKRVGFSGDVGRFDDVLMCPPKPLPELDLLLLESTYGDRRHEAQNTEQKLAEVVRQTAQDGGVLLIPAFAVGRAQAVQYLLAKLMNEGTAPKLPIYLDSPMAIKVSDIFCRYHAQHRLDDSQCEMLCNAVTYTRTVDDSKALADLNYPHIIIAGSGMATGGRILHHFKRLLGNPRTRVLFTGYQAGGTRGAKMLEGASEVKIHGQWLPVKAHIDVIAGLSGHADYVEIGKWLAQSKLPEQCTIKLIHGDLDALDAQRQYLQELTDYTVSVAGYRDVLHVD